MLQQSNSNKDKLDILINKIDLLEERLLTIQVGHNIPIFVRLKDISKLFSIKKDSVYKYILPLVTSYKLGSIKLYKTEEIANAIESYEFYIP